MGTTLTGTTPQDTYDSLIKVTDNGPLSGTAKYLSDGLGNDSALALSTSAVGIGTTAPQRALHVNGTEGVLRLTSTASGNNGFEVGIGVESQAFLWQAENSYIQIATNATERMRITSAGNVGIGTSSPNSKLEVAAGTTIYPINITSSSDIATTTGISMGSFSGLAGGSNGSVYIASAHNHGASAQSSMVFYTHTGSSLTEKVRILAGGGLTFNGDTAAANALDDYEEGTFTATLAPSDSGTITLNATYSTWSYTKIGNQVTVNGLAVVSSVSSPVGTYIKIGLPFTVGNSDSKYGGNSCLYSDASLSYAKSLLGGYNPRNTSQSYVYIVASTIATNDEFYFTTTYFV